MRAFFRQIIGVKFQEHLRIIFVSQHDREDDLLNEGDRIDRSRKQIRGSLEKEDIRPDGSALSLVVAVRSPGFPVFRLKSNEIKTLVVEIGGHIVEIWFSAEKRLKSQLGLNHGYAIKKGCTALNDFEIHSLKIGLEKIQCRCSAACSLEEVLNGDAIDLAGFGRFKKFLDAVLPNQIEVAVQ